MNAGEDISVGAKDVEVIVLNATGSGQTDQKFCTKTASRSKRLIVKVVVKLGLFSKSAPRSRQGVFNGFERKMTIISRVVSEYPRSCGQFQQDSIVRERKH